MLSKEIAVGGVYMGKVSGLVVPLRVDKIETVEGRYNRRSKTVYHCVNLKTARKIKVSSARRFRRTANGLDKAPYKDCTGVAK